MVNKTVIGSIIRLACLFVLSILTLSACSKTKNNAAETAFQKMLNERLLSENPHVEQGGLKLQEKEGDITEKIRWPNLLPVVDGKYYVAPPDGINLRNSAKITGIKIRKLPQNTELTILARWEPKEVIDGIHDYWYEVDTGYETGSVFGGYLSLTPIYNFEIEDVCGTWMGNEEFLKNDKVFITKYSWDRARREGQSDIVINLETKEVQMEDIGLYSIDTVFKNEKGAICLKLYNDKMNNYSRYNLEISFF